MALSIQSEVLDNIVQVLTTATGEKVQDGTDALARLVTEHQGNEVMEEFTDNCKKMQASYNDRFVPAVEALLVEYRTMDEFRSAIAKAASNLTKTKVVDVDIAVDKIELPEL